MTRLLTLVAFGLAIAFAPTICEAQSQSIHVTGKIVESTLIGDPDNPKIGDQSINSVELIDDSGTKVGTATGICTLVTPPGSDALVQCLITAVFAEGQIIFGGIAPLPNIGAVGHFGILGGTGDFRKVHGEATLVVISPELQEATLDLE